MAPKVPPINNSPEETKLCASCLAENDLDVDFCKKCGYPLGQFVNIDPINRILSTGWLYRRLVFGAPPRPIVLWGMWLICASYFVLIITYFAGFSRGRPGQRISSSILLIVPSLAHAVILVRGTKNYFIRRKEKRDQEE